MGKTFVLITKNEECRGCSGTTFSRVLSLGRQPPANAFLTKKQLKKTEYSFPLDLYFCHTCALNQLRDIVKPEILFRDYVYRSSTSQVFINHFLSFAKNIIDRFKLPLSSFIIDIGSNDGILLKPFQEAGMRVLGIDPATKIAEKVTLEGIETLPYFFGENIARKIVTEKGQADVITGTNVFAHVNDLDGFLRGVKKLLRPRGIFIVEVPYLVDLLEKNLFDTIYHEHLSYFSISPMKILLERNGLRIFDVERVSVHGGSLRVFIEMMGKEMHSLSHRVADLLALEREKNINSLITLKQFNQRIERNKKELVALLKSLKRQGKRIAGYGAPAKGNTLLNYFQIGNKMIDYIVDDNTWKQGLFTPATHIPVVAPSKLELDFPDYIMILAWNFADSIIQKLEPLRSKGTKCIIPVPTPRIV